MMKKLPLLLCALALFSFVPLALAQPAANADLDKRMELSRKMHEIRPMTVQIEDAVKQLSLRYPEDKREIFITTMLQTFDRESLTAISVKAMAETFTVAELEKMIDFHGSAEGKAITEKMPIYQSLVEPELLKKIDKALMEVRTGKAAN